MWTPLAVHRASGDGSPLYRTTVRPHKIRDFVVVDLVAIDTTRVSMDLVMGPEEPEGTDVLMDKRTGLVPAARLPDLIAVTNGGFKKRHGNWGVGLDGVTAWNPRPEGCSFAKLKDESYRVATHPTLQPALEGGFAFFRQTPPCLIEDGKKHPDLAIEHKAKIWAGAEDGNKEIRRSAVGLGADGRTLYFAIGDYLTAEWLADGLLAAGVRSAAQLDINYSYTRFLTYSHAAGELTPSSPLLKELKAPKKEYWKQKSPRDFFMLTWKAAAPSP